ncbi:TPA: hypothetical protein JG832_002518 [Enterobacter hormaechei subsp. xiangfangensis]|nr:hypothetical protein [Enterobacter hormaechei subsp. xiangfangensis]HAV1890653.1 hypothetical protein [Enterobacter hormaechei subsp. xiangfangensis]
MKKPFDLDDEEPQASWPVDAEATQPEPEIDAPEVLYDAPELVEEDTPPPAPPAPAAVVAPLPAGMTDRPVTATMKSRYNGHAPMNNQVREDWMKIIEQDPFSYEALLYRPTEPVPTAPDDDGIETPLFTEINNNQVELDYQDPVIVTVLDCPDQREQFQAVDQDGDQDGLADDFLIIRAATRGVSIGSIFEWNEEDMTGGTVRRWWYVLRIYTLGTASVGSLYYCIPARNMEGSAEVVQNAG